MPKEKVLNSREFKKILRKNGYSEVSIKGDHFKWSNGINTIIFAKNLNRMIARRMIKTYNINVNV